MGIFEKLFKIENDNQVIITGLTDELNVIYIYNNFKEKNKSNLVVVNTLYEATTIYNKLLNYTNKVLFFPMDDFINSEALAISPELKAERLTTINKLIEEEKYIVVTNLMGYLRYLPKKEKWKSSVINLTVNEEVSRENLIDRLYDIGYENEMLVNKTGTMAIRGFVLDVFPIGEDNPIRIEFFGDEIDSIKEFDVDSQRSIKKLEKITIYPYSEFIIDKNNDEIIRKQKYLPFYLNDISSIYDYLENNEVFYFDYNQLMTSYNFLMEEIFEYKQEATETFDTKYMHRFEDINVDKEIFIMNVDNFVENKKIKQNLNFSSKIIDNYGDNIDELKKDLNKYLNSKKTIILAFNDKNNIKRFLKYLDIENYVLTNEKDIIPNKINIIVKAINSGFIYDNYVVISENDIYKISSNKTRYSNKFKLGTKVKDIKNIEIGDYIVHSIFGIGIYDGLKTITKNDVSRDYLKLIYKDNDVLYIPVEKIDIISKFSSKEGAHPALNKLGTDTWQKTKARVKKRLEDIAANLLKVSAERELLKGHAFSKTDELEMMFDSEFQYKETPDQIRATNMIKSEMEKEKPMDMLLCGDVGYGKTEVAFKAMFKAVKDSKQVAYLCPTTILSNQQYQNALDRFKNYSVRIELLNRFVSKKKQTEIINDLKLGKVDIVFGTHRILSKDIEFKDLGLLVVDEEQRFGVKHKEKIKEYKANIDILTLSATPIPRTLQMSMTGIRSLSLIETPPVDRYPIQTYVMPENKQIIKDAIYKELSRKGQIFILYNRVEKIEAKVKEINDLIPEARVDFVHGQMNKEVLEKKMINFIDGKFDILVCTTIIETGIDIPNVNTLIVIDADYFGLSQLYQIRGRIGRSNRIGYAYLMYNNRKELNDIAVKRLKTIKEFTELGSGFKIAMRDLSIRGSGDILGSEQSGFIDSVGMELYLKMLNDSINKLKGIEVEDDTLKEINKTPSLNITTHISDNYAKEDALKIEIHKKINEIDSKEKLAQIKEEIEDRFGKVNSDLEIYMYEEWFEKLVTNLDIIKVNQSKTSIELIFSKQSSSKLDGEKLFLLAYEISRNFRFSYSLNEIHVILDINKLDRHFIYYLTEFLSKIQKEYKKFLTNS